MKMGLGVKITTALTLSPQMQQAINLLPLSRAELEQQIQQKIDSNPLLERVEDSEAVDEEPLADDEADKLGLAAIAADDKDVPYQAMGEELDSHEFFAQNQFDLTTDSDWDEIYTHDASLQDEPNDLTQTLGGLSLPVASSQLLDPAQDLPLLPDGLATPAQTLAEHIHCQLSVLPQTQLEQLISAYLLDSLDERGFISLSDSDLLQTLTTTFAFYQINVQPTSADIEAVVQQIQRCDPVGVGARDLAECLRLQLKEMPADTPHLDTAMRLLAYPDYLVSNNIPALLKAASLQLEDIAPSLALLRTLSPNPANDFARSQQLATEVAVYDVPDILVTPVQRGGQYAFFVQLNPETLPKLRINSRYARLVRRDDQSEQGLYLKEQLSDARLFIRAIEERNQNLLKVANCIVKRQQGFFTDGVTAMQPLILRDVADEVGLHESTVSRITTSKTMLTPKGLFSLKYFFSSHVTTEAGEAMSSTAISAMIKQMIAAENPKKPLSDSAIMQRLHEAGISIARRTVAKYREAMHIGSSTQRKQRF